MQKPIDRALGTAIWLRNATRMVRGPNRLASREQWIPHSLLSSCATFKCCRQLIIQKPNKTVTKQTGVQREWAAVCDSKLFLIWVFHIMVEGERMALGLNTCLLCKKHTYKYKKCHHKNPKPLTHKHIMKADRRQKHTMESCPAVTSRARC